MDNKIRDEHHIRFRVSDRQTDLGRFEGVVRREMDGDQEDAP